MNETKILAAILTIAASAREERRHDDIGKTHWSKVIEDYKRILKRLMEEKL